MDRNILIEHGIDYDDGVKRLLGNSAIYEKCLAKFVNDEAFHQLKAMLSASDCEEAFKCAHTLKGVAASLSMKKLAKSAGDCCEALRAGKLSEAKTAFSEVENDYKIVMEALRMS